ncbi:hypothetical protein [Bacillus thuringiensis]|uniref:hypothetical protein n=1 Tax=Bacillus thuringiensis TaxID=1428 RepID=UPI000BEC8E3B|nr:hypothetical protein [Bacillus thuringiensis]PEB12976.1 hypothetical protein COM67_09465 [Bacillus thuringiensis]
MWEFIVDNKVLSGFAGAVLAAIVALVTTFWTNKKNKKGGISKQSIKSGDNSFNIQGDNVKVTMGDKNVPK